MGHWLFSRRRAADRERATTVAEFFATDSIKNSAESLVRESIQNSMDAGVGPDPVHVRFALGDCVERDVIESFLEGLQPHLEACGIALDDSDRRSIRYLTVEDFHTTGLRGDPTDVFETNGSDNEYFYFYRAEGKSGKSTDNRGSWGVGKFTLPLASRVRAFVGYTCRDASGGPGADGPLVMGQIVLTPHKVDGVSFQPDGWWSDRTTDDSDDPVPIPFGLPGRRPDLDIEGFAKAFDLHRSTQPGLSVVVPFLREDITQGALTEAVLRNFGVAIELGGLTVSISGPNGTVELTRGSIVQTIESMGGNHWVALRDEVHLASWYLDEGQHRPLELRDATDSMNWDERLRPEEIAAIRAAIEFGQRCAVRVPLPVIPKTGTPTTSWFDVVLEPHDSTDTPLFYREGLRISEVKAATTPGVRCIVLVSDEPLARMLGAAETPAHVDWQARTERFRGRYHRGRDWLSFIKKAPAEIVRRLHDDGPDEDLGVAALFFSLPADEGKRGRAGKGGTVPPPSPPPPPPPAGHRIDRTADGFRVSAGPSTAAGDTLVVTMAYDVRRGNPFRRWSELDFTVTDLRPLATGAIITGAADNRLDIEVTDPTEFGLTVTGFDPHRDLVVSVSDQGADPS